MPQVIPTVVVVIVRTKIVVVVVVVAVVVGVVVGPLPIRDAAFSYILHYRSPTFFGVLRIQKRPGGLHFQVFSKDLLNHYMICEFYSVLGPSFDVFEKSAFF